LEKLMHLTELLEQLQCTLQAYPDRAPVTLNYHETLDWVYQGGRCPRSEPASRHRSRP
jgi:hypothetical protein